MLSHMAGFSYILWWKNIQLCVYVCLRVYQTGSKLGKWFQVEPTGCISSLCLFNLYAEYIMKNAVLDEAQAEIKIARRISVYQYIYVCVCVYIYIYIYINF